ncbi:hypothetical protein [Anaerostipes sp.]
MSKVKKGKRVAAAAMAVALSMVTVTTGVLPNTNGSCTCRRRWKCI